MTDKAVPIVVLISGNGSNLQAIIDYFETRAAIGKVVAVISNRPNAYGLERADNANIANICLDHTKFESREAYDSSLQTLIDKYQPGLVVLAGFMRILTAGFVEAYQGRMINIHPSLLPKYRGLNTHQKAIDAGDQEHGASVHFVTPDLDGGPVIIQSKVPIFAEDSVEELTQRVQEQERNIFPIVVDWFCQRRLIMQNNKAVMDGNKLPESGYATD